MDKKTPTISQRSVDLLVKIVSSWYFVLAEIVFIAVWVGLNQAKNIVWDPYPFDILKIVLMIELVIIGSIIIMNQQRQSQFDRKIIYQDYIINCRIQKELHDIHPLINEHRVRMSEIISILKQNGVEKLDKRD